LLSTSYAKARNKRAKKGAHTSTKARGAPDTTRPAPVVEPFVTDVVVLEAVAALAVVVLVVVLGEVVVAAVVVVVVVVTDLDFRA